MWTLDSRQPGFPEEFARLVEAGRDSGEDVGPVVTEIIRDVRERGDAALVELTRKFDGFDGSDGFRVEDAEIDALVATVDPDLIAAMELAAERIRTFHEAQLPADHEQVRWRRQPHRLALFRHRAGRHLCPGRAGRAVFLGTDERHSGAGGGVERLVMTTPSSGGKLSAEVVAAARIAGVEEIYRVGGAQAIAALAHGTETIPAVDFVAGPGNAWVAEAKRQLYGRIGIDMVAGPSEILIVADDGADADVVAADLLEPGGARPHIAVDPDHRFGSPGGRRTGRAGGRFRRDRDRRNGARQLGCERRDRAGRGAGRGARADQHAGPGTSAAGRGAAGCAVRKGPSRGKRLPGLSHAGGHRRLYRRAEPRAADRSPRAFLSGLGTLDFMKRTTFLECSEAGFRTLGPAAARMADAETLPAHALSVRRRLVR